jgi:hypothetical protein
MGKKESCAVPWGRPGELKQVACQIYQKKAIHNRMQSKNTKGEKTPWKKSSAY